MVWNILDFGAESNSAECCTGSIQAAIDACCTAGGGTVIIPPGKFTAGTLELKSNVRLHLEHGAVLYASANRADYRRLFPDHPNIQPGTTDYPFNIDEYFIYALGARNVAITGGGMIHAQGRNFYHSDRFRKCIKQKPGHKEYILKEWRPGPTVCFLECEDITVQGITIEEHPLFALTLLHCRNAVLTGLKIHTDIHFINGDGIHLKSSQNVTISDCQIDVEDDAICFYTDMWERTPALLGNEDYTTSNITVSNCIFSTACSAIRIGFMGDAPLRNILFNNIIVKQAEAALDVICCGGESFFSSKGKIYKGPLIENIHLANFIAENVKWGITLNSDRNLQGDAGIRNFLFSGVRIHSACGSYLAGTAEHPLCGMTFRDCFFKVDGFEVSEETAPEYLRMFKNQTFPGGMLLRHTSDVTFANTTLEVCKARQAFTAENDRDTDISGLRIKQTT